MSAPTPTVRALLRRSVDYAGLFPPAALSMRGAAEHYATHLRSPEAWMLARFVVPVERLDELALAAGPLVGEAGPWRLSALLGGNAASDGARIREFNTAQRGRFVVDVVECRATDVGSVRRVVGELPGELRSFVELPQLDDSRAMLEAIGAAGAWAKVRTGGVTPDAFPPARQVAALIAHAAEVRVPFKATAGLHHPLTGEYPATYDADAPRATMFGFLNMLAAAVFALRGTPESRLVELLEERDPSMLRIDAEMLGWRGLSATAEQIASARASRFVAFGSCSFAEPVEGLRSMRLL
ncbi:MAG: hypothetical protein ABI601_00775 [bacterium]